MLGRTLLRGSGRESSGQEISSGRCTEQQQQPSYLQVAHCWCSFQESLVGGDLRSQMIFHEIDMPQRGAQDHHSLVSGRQVVIPSPNHRIGVQHSSCLLEDFHARRLNAPSIPHLGFFLGESGFWRDATTDPSECCGCPRLALACRRCKCHPKTRATAHVVGDARTASRTLCCPTANRAGIKGSPCSPLSPWAISWTTPKSFSQMFVEAEL